MEAENSVISLLLSLESPQQAQRDAAQNTLDTSVEAKELVRCLTSIVGSSSFGNDHRQRASIYLKNFLSSGKAGAESLLSS